MRIAFVVHGGPQGSMGNSFHYRWNPQAWAGAGRVGAAGQTGEERDDPQGAHGVASASGRRNVPGAYAGAKPYRDASALSRPGRRGPPP